MKLNTGIKYEDEDKYINADFALLNKNDTVEEYRNEIRLGRYRNEACKVMKTVELCRADYEKFCNSLLSNYEWLSGEGGYGSLADLRSVDSYSDYTEEERREFNDKSYREVVEVRCISENHQTLYVDPQGHNYARYVGF